MSQKFKVGDRVVLNGVKEDPLEVGYVNTMDRLIGRVLTIKRKSNNKNMYKIKECPYNYWYYSGWFDPAEPVFQLEEELFLI